MTLAVYSGPFETDIIIMTDRFYLLLLEGGAVRLFRGNSEGLSPLRFPHGLMVLDGLIGGAHVGGFGGPTSPASVESPGHRREPDVQMDNRERWSVLCDYLRQLEVSVLNLIDRPGAPLVLAGSDQLITAYRSASRYSAVVPTGIVGQGFASDMAALHARAQQVLANIRLFSEPTATQ